MRISLFALVLVITLGGPAAPWPAAASPLPAARLLEQTSQGCQVTYRVADQWTSGFTADVSIANAGPALNGWALTWAFPAGQRLGQAWNASASQNGATVQASNASWNASLSAGGVASFGFSASHGGSNPPPTAFSLNGVACTVAASATPTPPAATPTTVPTSTRTATATATLAPTSTRTPPATATAVLPSATTTASLTATATSTPTATPTSTRTPTPVPSATVPASSPTATAPGATATVAPTVGGGSCQVGYRVTDQWSSGFTAEVTLRNLGPAVDGWVATWAFPSGQQLDQAWNAAAAQTGAAVRATNASWNGALASGASTSFGFNARHTGTNAPPVAFALNGAACAADGGPPPATPTPGAGGATLTPTPGAGGATPTAGPPPPSATPVAAPTPNGAPGRPAVSVQKVWDVGGGVYYDVLWSLYSGAAATTWQVLEDGRVIHSGTLAAGSAIPQSASYRVQNHRYGAYSYQVVVANAAGATTSDPVVYAVGGASKIVLDAADAGQQATQVTVAQGTADYRVRLLGVTNPSFTLATNNRAVLGYQLVDGTTVRLQGLQAGRASLRITETTTGEVRYLGVRVRTTSGQVPGLPDYLAVGSVSEDSDADLGFWRGFADDATNRRMDVRYVYINGGPFNGWRTWTPQDGGRAVTFVRESKKLGIIPFFVYYNIPDGGESYYTDKQHIEDPAYLAAYFADLKFFLDLVRQEAGDEPVGIVLEPDFLGYLMQNSGGNNPVPPNQLLARTSAAYTSGVLSRTADPAFPDTVEGLVRAINYTIQKYAPDAVFGWQFNLWASPGITTSIPANGLLRKTDTLGIAAGRSAIASEAPAIANYYLSAGVTSYGASFVSIDKYGLDAGSSNPGQPANSTWFWNADHWNNYLLFTRTLRATTGLPVVLWQLPVGHVNTSQAANPYPGGGLFPTLTNVSTRYEDSAPTFFLGDTFRPGSAERFDYFRTNQGGDPKVQTVGGDTVTWGSHMAEARDSGITVMLFGAGVGDSTDGVGAPPTDGSWWITQAQRYFANPVPLR